MTAAYGKDSESPCGKDVYALSKTLSKAGYDVAVLTVTKENKQAKKLEEITLYKVESLTSYRKLLLEEYIQKCNIIKKLKLHWALHKINHKIANTYFMGDLMSYDALNYWIKELPHKTFDLLISVSYPFYIQEYAKFVRKKLHIKKWLPYLLDPHADNIHCYKDKRKRRVKRERNLFKTCTNICTVEEIVTQAQYSPIKKFLQKIQYIPTHLMTDNTKYYNKNDTESVQFVYTGLFYPDIRNPEKLLQYFTQLPDNYILNLYSKGCVDIITKYKEILGDRLQLNDYILDQEEYNKMIGKSDFLVDVGNTVSNQVPSKILTYCSFGKPIIHFKNCENEVIGEKFRQYPLFNIVDYSDDISIVVKKIENIVKKDFGKTVSYHEVSNNFSECTVDYVAEKIKNILGE